MRRRLEGQGLLAALLITTLPLLFTGCRQAVPQRSRAAAPPALRSSSPQARPAAQPALRSSHPKALQEFAGLERLVTLDFSGAPLADVIRFLRERTGVLIVLDPSVAGARSEEELRVDLKVEQLAARGALEVVCSLKGLSYLVQRGRVLVHAHPPAPGQSVTRVYNVRDLTLKIPDFKGIDIDLGPPPAPLLRFPSEAEWRKIARRGWKRSSLPPHTCRVQVGDGKPLPLVSVRAHLSVDGFRARVLLDYVFRNDRNQQLEGTFQLRLPDGASPYFLAFGQTVLQAALPEPTGLSPESILADRKDAWADKPRVARMVDRRRAAQAYTATVKRRVDPALLEWRGAGVFDARVFPLQPGQPHRVVIGYDVTLPVEDGNRVLRFELPQKEARRRIVLSVAGQPLQRFDDPARPIVVSQPARPTLLAGEGYFAAAFQPELPDAPETAGPRRAVFLVDLSGSTKRFDRWLALLREILERGRPRLEQFAVLLFDVRHRWWRGGFVANTPANLAALLAELGRQALSGATDLSGALRRAAARAGGAPLFLLGDGAATWGPTDIGTLVAALRSGEAGPLYAYTTGEAGAATEVLRALANAGGGAVFAATTDAALPAAATAHRRRPWRLVDVQLPGGGDLLLAGRPHALYPGQRLLLVGRGRPERGAAVSLTLARDGQRRTVRVALARRLASPLAPRAYGQVAVGELELLPAAEGHSTVRAYARHFRVVGRNCSLLMLEGEADYQRFGIVPADDAVQAAKRPARELLARLERPVLDARQTFLAWLDRIGAPAPLRSSAARLPESAFLIDAALDDSAAGGRLAARSNDVERHPGNPDVARGVALEALAAGHGDAAYWLVRHALRVRPDTGADYLTLARCLVRSGRTALAALHYALARTRALPGLADLESGRAEPPPLSISIVWDTDATDVDLHVVEPDGTTCYYDRSQTPLGGRLSSDVTRGFGPELYRMTRRVPGIYVVRVKLFRADRNRAGGRTRVYLRIAHGGRVERRVVAMDRAKQVVEAARIELPAD